MYFSLNIYSLTINPVAIILVLCFPLPFTGSFINSPSTTNTGLKTNYAEISKDSADDIDSTPDNFNLKEDDIDDAQVIISIKTAGPQTYVGLILLSVTILAGGIFLIKKYVIK